MDLNKLFDDYFEEQKEQNSDEVVWEEDPVTFKEFIASSEHMNFPPYSQRQLDVFDFMFGDEPKKIFENMPINPFLRPKNMKRIKLLDTSFLKNGSDLFKNRINAEKIDLEYHSKKNSSSFSMPEINPEQFQEAQCISNEYIKSKLLY